jgi:hypothetical protein
VQGKDDIRVFPENHLHPHNPYIGGVQGREKRGFAPRNFPALNRLRYAPKKDLRGLNSVNFILTRLFFIVCNSLQRIFSFDSFFK